MDILNSIPILSEINPVKPVSLEDIQRIHSSLTLENPLTFMIFLSKRPDLGEEDKQIYLKIIERLKANEKFKYESTMAYMVSSHLPAVVVSAPEPAGVVSQPVTDIGGNIVYDA